MPYLSRVLGRFRLSILLLVGLAVGSGLGFVLGFLHLLNPSATLILSTIGWFLVLVGGTYYVCVYHLFPIYTSAHAEASVAIHAPLEKVIALDMDYTSWPKFSRGVKHARWIDEHENERIVEVQVINGVTYRESLKLFGNRIEHEVDERRWKASEIWSCETIPDGTRLTITADLTVRGWRPKAKFRSNLEKSLAAAQESLKKLAEA